MFQPSAERDQADFDFLWHNAQSLRAMHIESFMHLDQPIALWNYIHLANGMAAQLTHGTRILDWGCGAGQMTYLLSRRGFSVTAYDVQVERNFYETSRSTPLGKTFDLITSNEPVALPFSDAQFDAVLSCGVLEHVDENSEHGNELKSLREVNRILKPHGHFLVYQLPQVHAWQEAMIRRFKLGYSHPRRYTPDEIVAMLDDAGFHVVRLQRANMIPKRLTGMPASIRDAYSKASKPLLALDHALSNLPGLRAIAGVIELTAVKL